MDKKKVTTHIKAESSISAQVNGAWYKFVASEEQDLFGFTEDEADEALKQLFDKVNNEVDSQMGEAISVNA